MNNSTTGVVSQAGTVAFRAHRDSAAAPATPGITINNNGGWTVSGTGAVIRRLTTSDEAAYIAIPAFNNSSTGTLRGNSASDALEFNEEVADGTRRMTITNNGIIAPGAGTSGGGVTSVGVLNLRDINLTTGATGKINMDFGGSTAGQYDQINLQTGLTDPTGAGALDLSAVGDILNLFSVNSFAPSSAFTVSLLTAGSVTSTFDNITLNAAAFTLNQLVVAEGTYEVLYDSDSVDLTFTPIPEPTSLTLLALGAVTFLGYHRRARLSRRIQS